MKEIYILEHASWNPKKFRLTDEGLQDCHNLKIKLGDFDKVVCSRDEWSRATVHALTNKKPVLDSRAAVIRGEDRKEMKQWGTGQNVPYGFTGQKGEQPYFRKPINKAGEKLLSLVKDTLSVLPADGKALIISHNQNLIAAEMILLNKRFSRFDHGFQGCWGLVIDEKMNLKYLKDRLLDLGK
jgi:hypothetical protein